MNLQLSDFEYDLPKDFIAQKPLERRDDSRLMVLDRERKSIEHSNFHHLPDFLAEGDILVLNRTKVIPARLRGRKEGTGGKVEVLLLKMREDRRWECLARPGRSVKVGVKVRFGQDELIAEVIGVNADGIRIIRFDYRGDFGRALDRVGEIPIPPYIRDFCTDRRLDGQSLVGERYQTVYANEEGAVASPTAGLHFSEELLERIKDRGVKVVFLTLHLGLGSFQPIRVSEIEKHRIQAEFYRIPEETVRTINEKDGRRIIAVGTSTIRALETVAEDGQVKAHSDWTQLFIYPGYQFQMVSALITNFHLPGSSNLLLASAFAGREFLLSAYREAIKERYRFYSFGDAMLIK